MNVDDIFARAYSLRKHLEGPAALRTIGGLGGGAMVISSIYSMLHIMAELHHPSALILKVYEALFGFAIMVVELKDIEKLEKLRLWFYRVMPFLTVMLGKGAFYIFAGSLAGAFFRTWTLFVPGFAVFLIGIIYCMMHFAKCQKADEFEQNQPLVH